MTNTATDTHTCLIEAIDGAIHAALVVVGMRLVNKPACPRPERAYARTIPLAELHARYRVDDEFVDAWRLLDGAWDRIPSIAARYDVDPATLTAAVDDYVRALIKARIPHDYNMTERVIRRAL